MTTPTRVQRKRTSGSRLPAGTLCCTRPGFWSNPIAGPDAGQWFRRWLAEMPYARAVVIVSLARDRGDNVMIVGPAHRRGQEYLDRLDELREYAHLACWCRPDRPDCHVATLVELLEREQVSGEERKESRS